MLAPTPRPARAGRRLGRLVAGDLVLELADGFGHLADDGAEHGNVALDGFEALAGIEIGEGIDALAEHGAGLGVGGEEAREILDGLFEPILGALTQDALGDDNPRASKHHGHQHCVGGGEDQRKISQCANGD